MCRRNRPDAHGGVIFVMIVVYFAVIVAGIFL